MTIRTLASTLVEAMMIRDLDGHVIGLQGGPEVFKEWEGLREALNTPQPAE